MGWNSFTRLAGPLFNNISAHDDVYYVHSYYAEIGPETVATCTYIRDFACAFQKDNFYATQFHPEKSAEVGEQILKNFLAL
jgi:glutamine amidotransferase